MLNPYQTSEPTLQIDVVSPEIRTEGSKRYVVYTVKMKTTLPVFNNTESTVQRRYSDFEWLHKELERADTRIAVPSLPDKAWQRQLPFRKDNGLFQDDFIEERRQGLEKFINKVASHPLVQNERSLHVFLLEPEINLSQYTRGKIKP